MRQALEERFGYSLYLSNVQEEAAFGACVCNMVSDKN